MLLCGDLLVGESNMKTLTVTLMIVFMLAITTVTLRACYHEIFYPFTCEKIWPAAKSDEYYRCVKARALQRGFVINEE